MNKKLDRAVCFFGVAGGLSAIIGCSLMIIGKFLFQSIMVAGFYVASGAGLFFLIVVILMIKKVEESNDPFKYIVG